MPEGVPFRRVAILGTGLIGASFGLALHDKFPQISIVAYDRPEVLRQITERGWKWKIAPEIGSAVSEADLIYIALPIGAAMEILPSIAAKCGDQALVTDAASTKVEICRLAETIFCGRGRFLGGHPIAGKENSGIQNADAALFRGARYALIGTPREEDDRVVRFASLLSAIGAEPVWCDADTHDWALAVVSQMPQLLIVALARVISDETDETGLPTSLAGRGLRDLLRIAGSPYEVWRDICLTNTENISRSLDRVTQAIDFLRTRLANRELEQEFRVANELYKSLHSTRRNLQ
ncbi:MAG TPA: prephenate dehydrogenase/arogenate dehydrogenase family protein [Candidatus Acidoferrales bacterium]|nr:prephenate dehydrogenase/arogenate dehydrogenase family protein [Candidatus Acidoferrales bacterium]